MQTNWSNNFFANARNPCNGNIVSGPFLSCFCVFVAEANFQSFLEPKNVSDCAFQNNFASAVNASAFVRVEKNSGRNIFDDTILCKQGSNGAEDMLRKQSLLLENKKLFLLRVKLWPERRLVKNEFIFYQRNLKLSTFLCRPSAKREREMTRFYVV